MGQLGCEPIKSGHSTIQKDLILILNKVYLIPFVLEQHIPNLSRTMEDMELPIVVNRFTREAPAFSEGRVDGRSSAVLSCDFMKVSGY